MPIANAAAPTANAVTPNRHPEKVAGTKGRPTLTHRTIRKIKPISGTGISSNKPKNVSAHPPT